MIMVWIFTLGDLHKSDGNNAITSSASEEPAAADDGHYNYYNKGSKPCQTV